MSVVFFVAPGYMLTQERRRRILHSCLVCLCLVFNIVVKMPLGDPFLPVVVRPLQVPILRYDCAVGNTNAETKSHSASHV